MDFKVWGVVTRVLVDPKWANPEPELTHVPESTHELRFTPQP
jgi:heat shock protein HspQ